MKAILFQGQGSQRKGMGADLFEQFAELAAEASDILGYNLRDMCCENPNGSLDRTEITQPAIYTVSVMRYRATKIETAPAMMAGHSLGEYVALHAAGAISFADGLRLVQHRGRLMGKIGGGGLVAVIGYGADEIERLIAEDQLDGVEIANINAPEQVVVGGRKNGLQRLLASCRSRGIRAVPLRVSGAFHTTQMRAASDEFAELISGVRFTPPTVPVLSNVTGQPHVIADIGRRLVEQIASPVQWVQCIETMLRSGVTDFQEIGSPQVLTPMSVAIRQRWQGETKAAALPLPQTKPHGVIEFEVATPPDPACRVDTRKAADARTETLPDWLLPELRSRSLFAVHVPALAAASQRLEACYHASKIEPVEIADIAASVESPFRERLVALADRMTGVAGTRARRSEIRSAASQIFYPGLTVAEGRAGQTIFAAPDGARG